MLNKITLVLKCMNVTWLLINSWSCVGCAQTTPYWDSIYYPWLNHSLELKVHRKNVKPPLLKQNLKWYYFTLFFDSFSANGTGRITDTFTWLLHSGLFCWWHSRNTQSVPRNNYCVATGKALQVNGTTCCYVFTNWRTLCTISIILLTLP